MIQLKHLLYITKDMQVYFYKTIQLINILLLLEINSFTSRDSVIGPNIAQLQSHSIREDMEIR